MVKFIFNNLGGSILRTFGRIIAYLLIGVALYFLVEHFQPSQQTINSLIRGLLV